MFDEYDLIHRFTRRQAILDGVLIDVTPVANEAGIRYPTALTRAVWENYVRVPEDVFGQDETGRLWDILWLLRLAAGRSSSDTISFTVFVRNDNTSAKEHPFKAICGPDDDASPCITVLLPTED